MLSILVFIAVVVVLVGALVAAERSTRAQRGTMLKRTPEEDEAAGNAMVTISRTGGGTGGRG